MQYLTFILYISLHVTSLPHSQQQSHSELTIANTFFHLNPRDLELFNLPHLSFQSPQPRSFPSPISHLGTAISQTPNMTSEFHRFKELPLELRIQIWREASNVSRDVKVLIKNSSDRLPGFDFETNGSRYGYTFPFCANNSPPAILQVNQESRYQGLRIYKAIARNSSIERGSSVALASFLYISPNDFVITQLVTSSFVGNSAAVEKFLEQS